MAKSRQNFLTIFWRSFLFLFFVLSCPVQFQRLSWYGFNWGLWKEALWKIFPVFLSFLSSQELLKNQSPPFWPLFSSSSSLFRVTLVQNFFFFCSFSFLFVCIAAVWAGPMLFPLLFLLHFVDVRRLLFSLFFFLFFCSQLGEYSPVDPIHWKCLPAW